MMLGWLFRFHKVEQDEAAEEVAKAHRDLNDTRRRTGVVVSLTAELRDMRQDNHFAASLAALYRGQDE